MVLSTGEPHLERNAAGAMKKRARPVPLDRAAVAASLAGMLLGFPLSTHAADATSERINDLERKLEQSMQMIESLSNRIKQLEAGGAGNSTPVRVEQQPDAMAERVRGLEQQVSTLSSQVEAPHGVPIHGFADVGYEFNNQGRPRGAALGNLNFYIVPDFGDRVKSLIELTFEAIDGNMEVDLERLQIGYVFSDRLTLWTGRFHTPYGYWNTAFHHGAQMQTSILRPRFIDFEDKGGILPAHVVGLWGTGFVPLGAGRVTYDAYVGNAPRIELANPSTPGTGTLNPNLSGSTNHSAIVGGKLAYEFRQALDGLTVGVHGFGTRVEDDADVIRRADVRMYGAYGVYLTDKWEVLSEYYRFANKNDTGLAGTRRSWASYVQVGKPFGQWTPYVRAEKTSLDQGDNYFAQMVSGQSYARAALGLRYDVNPKAALKLELNHTKLTDRQTDRFQEARLQYAVRF